MKVSYKAALMSGFVFPGAGYLSLKLYRRAAVTMGLAGIFFYGLVQVSMMKAQTLIDLLIAGEVSPDTLSMLKALQDISELNMGWQDYAGYGFLLCWGISVFDAIRLAKKV
jgi:hypothetical protein